jgi:hypothetical protein
MKPLSHAFEIGYGLSAEVLDHSEVSFGDLPGTPGFFNILPRLKSALPADRVQLAEQLAALLPRIQELVDQPAVDEYFRIGTTKLTVMWERRAQRTGVCSILVDSKIASVSLLACRCDDLEPTPAGVAAEEIYELPSFVGVVSRFLPEEGWYDNRKFHLIKMTRRPLLASMFWPPFTPTGDSVARTIQRQVAYAFFRLNGEVA